jgi:hypothetical protein
MWIPILITVLAAALAIGPVMWFRSTPSQRRIIEFRGRAARLGLQVRLVSLADLGVAGEEAKVDTVAAYGLAWVRDAQDDNKVTRRAANRAWCLLKQRISHEGHFAGWWNWQPGREADTKWHAPLRALLVELPADVLALENNRLGLWLYWREKGQAERVEQIASILQRMKRIGQEL